MTTFVNGPINAFRLEGKVGDVNKVIYLFGDWHLNIEFQTECENIRSQEFKNYLIDNFEKSDRVVDFFLEIQPYSIIQPINIQKEKYIWGIINFFKKVSNKLDTVSNLRLQYLDIRDYLLYKSYTFTRELNQYIDNCYVNKYITLENITTIKNTLEIITSRYKFLYDLIYNNTNLKSNNKNLPIIPESVETLAKYTEEEVNNNAKRLINKILYRYNNDDVKKIIHKLIENELSVMFHEYFESVIDMIEYLQSVQTDLNIYYDELNTKIKNDPTYGLRFDTRLNILTDISTKYERIYTKLLALGATITDLYLLRRLLDKEYITNGVCYTGLAHTCNYIYYLVKYFDFKITDYSHLALSIDESTKIIKQSVAMNDMQYIIYPPKLVQCSNLTEFPKGFA